MLFSVDFSERDVKLETVSSQYNLNTRHSLCHPISVQRLSDVRPGFMPVTAHGQDALDYSTCLVCIYTAAVTIA